MNSVFEVNIFKPNGISEIYLPDVTNIEESGILGAIKFYRVDGTIVVVSARTLWVAREKKLDSPKPL